MSERSRRRGGAIALVAEVLGGITEGVAFVGPDEREQWATIGTAL